MVPWKPVSDGYFITGNLFHKCSIKPRTYHFLIFLFVTFLEANQQFFPQHKDTPHFRECHKWYTNSPFLYSHRWKRGWSWPWALTFCMEDPEIPGRIQMERFIPVEIFREKSKTFRGITFFPYLPKRPKFSVPFVCITSARLHVKKKWKIYQYFVNVTTQSGSYFRCQKQYQYHLTEMFHRNFRANGKRLLFWYNLSCFVMQIMLFLCYKMEFSKLTIRKGRKFVSKRGQPGLHVYSKVRIKMVYNCICWSRDQLLVNTKTVRFWILNFFSTNWKSILQSGNLYVFSLISPK